MKKNLLKRNKNILADYVNNLSIENISLKYKLADNTIKKIILIEKSKKNLFDKLKTKGIFWSFDKNISYFEFNDDILIEYAMKYGDFDDIIKIIRYYGINKAKKIWSMKMKGDMRFLKINLLIARVFFQMDVDVNYFKEITNGRIKKIKQLAQ